ncbi:MAG: hypothetical protein ACR2HG_01345 [Pyrinomonadaceae bacterium]
MKLKVILTLGVASLAFSACGGATTNTNLANKAANATNTVVNVASNATNSVANTMTTNSNANTMAATNGDVLKIDEAGIMMTVPKGFKFSKDGEDTIVQSEDEGVDIRFTVPKDGDYDKAVTDAAQEVDDYLKDVKVTDKGSKRDVDGMEGTRIAGTAKNEGEDVFWNLTVLKAPKKTVLINIYAAKSSLEKYSSEVEQFLKSVKKQ